MVHRLKYSLFKQCRLQLAHLLDLVLTQGLHCVDGLVAPVLDEKDLAEGAATDDQLRLEVIETNSIEFFLILGINRIFLTLEAEIEVELPQIFDN